MRKESNGVWEYRGDRIRLSDSEIAKRRRQYGKAKVGISRWKYTDAQHERVHKLFFGKE